MKKPLLILGLALVLVGIVTIFSGAPAADTLQLADTQTAYSDVGMAKELSISAKNYAFEPKIIMVNKGDHVRIMLTNDDGFHDLRIDEFNVATKKLNTGGQDIVEFVADKTGTFEYYCSIGSHRLMGMKGTLIVQ